MTDILGIIKTQREARGWSEYQLAERSGLPQSTISSWYKKDMTPSFASLEKICDAFGITLSQFFADGEESVVLTPSQHKMLDNRIAFTLMRMANLFGYGFSKKLTKRYIQCLADTLNGIHAQLITAFLSSADCGFRQIAYFRELTKGESTFVCKCLYTVNSIQVNDLL